MFRRLLPSVLSTAVLALTALPAGATTTFYIGAAGGAQETAFNLAAGVLTTLPNFSGYAGVLPGPTLAETTTGINFSASTNNDTSPANLALNGTMLTQVSGFGGGNSTIEFDVPGTVKAVAVHLSASLFGTYCYEAPGTTSCTSGGFGVDPTVSFFGVISDVALGDFQLRRTTGGSSTLLRLSDVSVGSLATTPEPSTLVLVGGGLILFPLLAKRRRGAAR